MTPIPPPRRPKCPHHKVWMAICDDCRDAHREPRPTVEKARTP